MWATVCSILWCLFLLPTSTGAMDMCPGNMTCDNSWGTQGCDTYCEKYGGRLEVIEKEVCLYSPNVSIYKVGVCVCRDKSCQTVLQRYGPSTPKCSDAPVSDIECSRLCGVPGAGSGSYSCHLTQDDPNFTYECSCLSCSTLNTLVMKTAPKPTTKPTIRPPPSPSPTPPSIELEEFSIFILILCGMLFYAHVQNDSANNIKRTNKNIRCWER